MEQQPKKQTFNEVAEQDGIDVQCYDTIKGIMNDTENVGAATRLKAAELLLSRRVPTLKNVSHDHHVAHSIQIVDLQKAAQRAITPEKAERLGLIEPLRNEQTLDG